MTHQEAIDYLLDPIGKREQHDEDIRMAISALQAQEEKLDTISRQAVLEVLSLGKEILSRVLNDMDVVGADREKYSWGLELIESIIKDIEELPPAQPDIVRCKDCIFHGFCRASTRWAVAPKDDWYCGDAYRRASDDTRAERRTDEQT